MAKLHADGGTAVSSEEFFRSPEFLAAEGVTHSLEAGPALLPAVVREIPESGGLLDALSPYGYPGAALRGGSGPIDLSATDWSGTGLVSLFVRDRVGPGGALAGGNERSRVLIHDPARPRRIRSRFASQIRRNEREGWEVRGSAGPAATELERANFLSLYTETMTRAAAAPRYFYDAAYFDAILRSPRTRLLHARSERVDIGSGAIAVLSDGVLHYYLGGTADRALDASPFKNVVGAMMDLADELGVPLNLGGGVRAGDGLEDFKRGFANAELPFVTHEVICDGSAYEALAAGRDAGGFFPAYRAP